MVLKPIGEELDLEAKQVGYSEKTISTVAVAKAMQVLLGINSKGQSYSPYILGRFRKFCEDIKSKGIIKENTKPQVFDGLDLPDLELAQGIHNEYENDAKLISKFIDSFI